MKKYLSVPLSYWEFRETMASGPYALALLLFATLEYFERAVVILDSLLPSPKFSLSFLHIKTLNYFTI